MNTHDIELPAEFCSGNDIPVTQATIKRERMEEILQAAIEADRQARGELWGWVIRGTGYRKEWTFTGESAERLAKRDAFLLGDESRAVPLYVGAAPQPQQTPEGYALVPIEPTREMVRAGWLIPLTGGDEIMADCDPDIEKIYRAMLEAAPQSKDK